MKDYLAALAFFAGCILVLAIIGIAAIVHGARQMMDRSRW